MKEEKYMKEEKHMKGMGFRGQTYLAKRDLDHPPFFLVSYVFGLSSSFLMSLRK